MIKERICDPKILNSKLKNTRILEDTQLDRIPPVRILISQTLLRR